MSLTFKERLLADGSKSVAKSIADEVVDDHNKMVSLMNCFFDEKLLVCQRASWPLGLLADSQPGLIYPYIEKMLNNLDRPHHNAVIRNTFRTFQFIDFPEEMEGLAFEKAFDYLLDINNAIAIRVFAMTVCGNIALKYPELGHELIPVIEESLPHGSAGFISRGNSVLRRLAKASL